MARNNRKKNNRRSRAAKQKSNPKGRIANALPIAPGVTTEVKPECYLGHSEQKGHDKMPPPEGTITVEFWLAAAVACATVVQAVVAAFQWNAMNKQNAVMIDQNEIILRQVEQTDEALAQAKLQTPQSLIRVKEAAIEVHELAAQAPKESGTPFMLIATLENVGALPATITGYRVSPVLQEFIPDGGAYKQIMDGWGLDHSRTQIVLTPGDTWAARAIYVPGVPHGTPDPLKGIPPFSVVVTVQYTDAAKENRRSRFIYIYSPKTGKLHAGMDGNYVE